MTVVVTEKELRLFIIEFTRTQNLDGVIKLINFDRRRFLPLIAEISKCERCEFYPTLKRILRELKIEEGLFMQRVRFIRDSLTTREDPYSILGVPRDASPQEIKRAWRKLIKTYHPDAGAKEQEKVKKINEAYRILSDPELRKDYDNLIPLKLQDRVILVMEPETSKSNQKWKATAAAFTILFLFGLTLLIMGYRRSLPYKEVAVSEGMENVSHFHQEKGKPYLLEENRNQVNKPINDVEAPRVEKSEGAFKKTPEIFTGKSPEKKSLVPGLQAGTTVSSVVAIQKPEEVSERVNTRAPEDVEHTHVEDKKPSETKATGTSKVEQPQVSASRQAYEVGLEQINAFFMLYSRAYSSGDVKKLMGFFTEDAYENGKPIRNLLNKYEELFKKYTVVYFRVRVSDFNFSEGTLYVRGDFSVTLNSEGSTLSSSGPINLKIYTYGRGINEWKIKELNYRVTSTERM